MFTRVSAHLKTRTANGYLPNCQKPLVSTESDCHEVAWKKSCRCQRERILNMTSIRLLIRATVVVLSIAIVAPAASASNDDPPVRPFQERTYQGKPFTYWLQVIRDRDKEMIPLAFDAIHSLGQDAWIAVPELTRLVAAPFDPIHIGDDSRKLLASKLYDIAVRTEAVETLGWIGEPASPSGITLIRWALTSRIAPGAFSGAEDGELFIDLVTMDTEQRMRVAGAIAAFGPGASPLIAGLLSSPDATKRKLGVAILSQRALPLAAELMRSHSCEDRQLGFLILKDMDLVVAPSYLDELQQRMVCEAN
jgi:hypothetical protein